MRRIEYDEGQVGVIKEQGMDQTVVGLTRQVPKNGFALRSVAALAVELIQNPELLSVS